MRLPPMGTKVAPVLPVDDDAVGNDAAPVAPVLPVDDDAVGNDAAPPAAAPAAPATTAAVPTVARDPPARQGTPWPKRHTRCAGCVDVRPDDLDFLSSLGHVHAPDADGETELEKIERIGGPTGNGVTLKIARDELESAVVAQCDDMSVYTLWWASRIIERRAGKKNVAFLTPGLLGPMVLLAIVAQLGLPFLILFEGENIVRMPHVICPGAYDGGADRTRTAELRCGIYVICLVTLFTNYQSIQQERVAYKFLATFRRGDLSAEVKGDDREYAADDLTHKDDGFVLMLTNEIQLLSFKLVLLASAYLFYTQSSISNIIMNSLALQFVLCIDNTITTPVRRMPLVIKEMASWFESYDWYGDRVTDYLIHARIADEAAGLFDFLGMRMQRPTVLPFLVFRLSPYPHATVDRAWFRRHWLIQLLSLTDTVTLPVVVYFAGFVGFCTNPAMDDDGDL